jgi:hypothetical protein
MYDLLVFNKIEFVKLDFIAIQKIIIVETKSVHRMLILPFAMDIIIYKELFFFFFWN